METVLGACAHGCGWTTTSESLKPGDALVVVAEDGEEEEEHGEESLEDGELYAKFMELTPDEAINRLEDLFCREREDEQTLTDDEQRWLATMNDAISHLYNKDKDTWRPVKNIADSMYHP